MACESLEEIDIHAGDKLNPGNDHALQRTIIGEEEVDSRRSGAGEMDGVCRSDLVRCPDAGIVVGGLSGEGKKVDMWGAKIIPSAFALQFG